MVRMSSGACSLARKCFIFRIDLYNLRGCILEIAGHFICPRHEIHPAMNSITRRDTGAHNWPLTSRATDVIHFGNWRATHSLTQTHANTWLANPLTQITGQSFRGSGIKTNWTKLEACGSVRGSQSRVDCGLISERVCKLEEATYIQLKQHVDAMELGRRIKPAYKERRRGKGACVPKHSTRCDYRWE